MIEKGTGDVQGLHGARYRLPKQLGSFETQKWDSSCPAGFKLSTIGPNAEKIVATVNIALQELHSNIGCPPLSMAGLYGANAAGKLDKLIICVGASHMRRLASALNEAGERAVHLEVNNFRATAQVINKVAEDLAELLQGKPVNDVAVLLGILDNCYYKARYEDGDLNPIRKDITGAFHVDGDVVCSPAESSKQMMSQLFPLFRKFPQYLMAVLTPLPRYLWNGCCQDLDHAPNVKDSDHVDNMMSSLAGTQRLWRGMIFREQLSHVKVFNCNSLIQDRIWWQESVHLTPAGYDRLASHITTCFINLVKKQTDLEEDTLDEAKKKPRVEEADPSRRISSSSWLARSDNFVAVPRGGTRGRGGFYRGRYGRPLTGNQGWRGYRY
jgi:hypothetical protein